MRPGGTHEVPTGRAIRDTCTVQPQRKPSHRVEAAEGTDTPEKPGMPRTSVQTALPPFSLIVREHGSQRFWEVKWGHRRLDGTRQQVKRRVGVAHVQRGDNGEWQRPRSRAPQDALDDRGATIAAERIIRQATADLHETEARKGAELARPITFREVAHGYLGWLEQVERAKPSTVQDHRSALAEPGARHRRGKGRSAGLIMGILGDRPAAEVTTTDVNAALSAIAERGVSARTVNKARNLIAAIYNFGGKPSTFGLGANPATDADRRREPQRDTLAYYTVEEIEAVARSFELGGHRNTDAQDVGEDELAWRKWEDQQDADIVRVAAYAGLRRGEIVALRWSDVNLADSKITVRRAVSGGQETGTKSGRVREVPLPRQAIEALDRRERTTDPAGHQFTGRTGYVFRARDGGRLDGSALRRRFVRARDHAELRPLRFHDLRHSYGSLLVASGLDLATVKAAMGHSRITTTERYLHARPVHEVAHRFTEAFAGAAVPDTAEAKRRAVLEALGHQLASMDVEQLDSLDSIALPAPRTSRSV